MADLEQFLSDYLPHVDLRPFIASFAPPKIIRRNRFYITPGKLCDTLGFVTRGCFRVYLLDIKGKEITTWFSFSGFVITDMLAFYTDTTARFYVQAMEDSWVQIIKKKELERLYSTYPEYRDFGRKFAEEALTMLMQRTLSLQVESVETRYKHLLQQPEFMQQIPLKHLASYLGITDTSLSRLRKRIR